MNTRDDSREFSRILRLSLETHGITSFGTVGPDAMGRIRAGRSSDAAAYGLDSARGAVVAALPYDTTGMPAGSLDPRSSIDAEGRILGDFGWFARSNWYRELVRILGAVVEDLRPLGSWSRSDFRIAVNSRLPEKLAAAAAGLGPIGKNTLLLNRRSGPGCVLGILLLPFNPSLDDAPDAEFSGGPGADCGDCKACVLACPTGAIRPDGGIRTEACLQYWASTDAPAPPEVARAWRGNLYGCDLCLASCPRFRPGVERPARYGRLGAGLPLQSVLTMRDEEKKDAFRGTALGLSWITLNLLRRNALLAAASRVEAFGPEVLGASSLIMRRVADVLVGSKEYSLASAAERLLNILE